MSDLCNAVKILAGSGFSLTIFKLFNRILTTFGGCFWKGYK